MDDFNTNETPLEEIKEAAEPVAESAAEETTVETEAEPETAPEAITEETAEDPAEITDEANDFAAPEVKKKKPVLQKTIIIAICIFLAAALAFGGVMLFKNLFGNSVVGTWIVDQGASSDEAVKNGTNIEYYTFEQDGDASISIGTLKVSGTWEYVDKDSKKSDQTTDKVSVNISSFFTGTFDITLDGNAFSGRTMKMKGSNNAEYKFKSVTLPENKITAPKDFKAVDGVTGKWVTELNGYKYTYNFKGDGLCEYSVYSPTDDIELLSLEGTYKVNTKDKVIDVTYTEIEENTMNIIYSIDDKNKGKKLSISGVEFSLEKE